LKGEIRSQLWILRVAETNINQYTFCNHLEDPVPITIETGANGKKRVANPCLEPCPIERGMRILGGKWKASILWHLKDGPVRFNDLARQLGGASKKMVDARLKEMEDEGLVTREVLATRPIAVNYRITEFGSSALSTLDSLKAWTEASGL
jgi:DNA-binding HxlR family transcriptional regulator